MYVPIRMISRYLVRPRVVSLSTLNKGVFKVLNDVNQGGGIFIDFCGRNAQITITSVWKDTCEVQLDSINQEFDVTVEESDGCAHICVSPDATSSSGTILLNLFVPEIINTYIKARTLSLTTNNKLAGDMSVECDSGSVRIDKLRGENLTFDLGSAVVDVRKVIEGNLTVRCASLNAKMINGDNIQIDCSASANIGAIYSKSARVCAGGVSVQGIHGSIHVENHTGNVSISGIDGNFHILNLLGDIAIQINKLCVGQSSANSLNGSLSVKVNPELSTHVTISVPDTNPKESIKLDVTNFHPTDASKPTSIAGFFKGESRTKNLRGRMHLVSGKIDLLSAKMYALHAERFVVSNGKDATSSDSTPMLSVRAAKEIHVESLSWRQAIQRKFGFEESEA